jgi:hypothetical protein
MFHPSGMSPDLTQRILIMTNASNRQTAKSLQTDAMDAIQLSLNAICDRANDPTARIIRDEARVQIDFCFHIGLITSAQKHELYEQFGFAIRLHSARPYRATISEMLPLYVICVDPHAASPRFVVRINHEGYIVGMTNDCREAESFVSFDGAYSAMDRCIHWADTRCIMDVRTGLAVSDPAAERVEYLRAAAIADRYEANKANESSDTPVFMTDRETELD